MPKALPAARRRFGSSLSASQDNESWRRFLCATVFDDPGRIADALSHRITGRFTTEPHHHADLLQLDLIHQCEGLATVDDREVAIGGTTLIATAPGVLHGYDLRPIDGDAAVWLVKLRIGSTNRSDWSQALPGVLTAVQNGAAVRDAMADFVRGWTPKGVGITALARLAAALSLWPTTSGVVSSESEAQPSHAVHDDSPSARVRRAVETLGSQLDNPPDLTALAAAAKLSARHFSRCFRQDFGCTPHDYLQARRLDAARGLLRDADRRVAGVAERLGFSSPAAFSRWFTRLAGQNPRAFRDDPHNF